ncbi:class I SAM-dependent methyltransferase [Metabacillus halosaccharovorans]|uniref:class I SAM-dependent methyltransferase n=1 Tax=Metabacillus halosaccharovorans TaxID=930124 RepID=UPI001C1FA12B|nr:class I SAM-dependent methyltransferase [Metabacillus halosaccharovorans]MBU7592868.1 class I SAM-dependent methyltransferase [Metabacillus halosaccharovorans]
MDHTNRFNGKADTYSKFRPSYPDELITNLITDYNLNERSHIADIGSGTGILTKKLVDFNLKVIAVEPNADMRRIAESQLKDNKLFTSINGTAENTTLNSNIVDFITVAQAFHWFDLQSFKKECQRILKPMGKVMIISNSRVTDSKIMKDIISIYTKYSPDFIGFSNGLDDSPETYEEFFFEKEYKFTSYDYPLIYNKQSFIGRHLSASYAPKREDKEYPMFIEELSYIFEKYHNSGFITLPNVTKTRCGLV